MNYFKRKFAGPFERPYGWAWILKLQAELEKNTKVLMNIRLKDAKKCGWPPDCQILKEIISQHMIFPLKETGSRWAEILRPLSSHVASLLNGFLPRF